VAGRPSRPAAAQIAKRRADAIQLRLAGIDYLTIGKKLAADPEINSQKVPYPAGYGIERFENGEPPPSDLKLAELVKQDLHRTMRQRRTKVASSADELRDLQDERLNRMLAGLWNQAAGGDYGAVDRVLKIMERQARLHGLDAPTRTEVTGADGAPMQVQHGLVTESEREQAIAAVVSFRADKQESAAALELLGPGIEEVEDTGEGEGLIDEDEDEDAVDAEVVG
jgi:hypothetical protein